MLPVETRMAVDQRAAPEQVRRRRAVTAPVRPVRRPLRQATVARAPSVATQGPAELGLSVVLAVPRPRVLVVRAVPVAPVGPRPRVVAGLSAPTPASIPVQQLRRRVGRAALSLRPPRLGLQRTTATRRARARRTRVTRLPVSPRVVSAPTPASMSAARILAPSISVTATRA